MNQKEMKQEKELSRKVYKIAGGITLFTTIAFLLLNHFVFFNPFTTAMIVNLGTFVLFVATVSTIALSSMLDSLNSLKKGIIIGGSLFAVMLVSSFALTTKIFHYEKYRDLAGEIEAHDFKEDISVVDISKLPIINEDLARNLADKKLGEITSLGSQMTIGDLTLQKVGETLYYVAPLEFTGFFKWQNNKGVSPGYVMVNAQKENDTVLVTELEGKKLSLKYLKDSYFGDFIKRKAYSYVKDKYLSDFTFELNNEGNPYWVVSMYDKTIFKSGDKVVGTLIIDAQTGEGKEYSIEETPDWVDRVQPLEIVNTNLNNWGSLVHGVFNFSSKDELKTTDGYKLIYNEDKCYYYTGITSVGSDESLVGFTLTDTRTGETNMYKVSGAIETSAMASAQGKVQEKGYTATFPVLINLQNKPTYFMTLLDQKGLIKGYSFVNVENYNIVSYGETLQDSYTNYVKILNNDASALDNNTELKVLEGIISRIGMKMNEGVINYTVTLTGQPQIFVVPDTLIEVTLSKVGDKVKVQFIENSTNTQTVSKFDNFEIEGEN